MQPCGWLRPFYHSDKPTLMMNSIKRFITDEFASCGRSHCSPFWHSRCQPLPNRTLIQTARVIKKSR